MRRRTHRQASYLLRRQQRPDWNRASFGPEDCDPLQEEAEAEESQADALPVLRLPGLPGCVAQNLLPLHRIISEKRRCRRHGRWCIAGGDENQGSDHARHRRGERQPIAGGQIVSPLVVVRPAQAVQWMFVTSIISGGLRLRNQPERVKRAPCTPATLRHGVQVARRCARK